MGSEEVRQREVVLIRPTKPVAELTDAEVDAMADDLHGKLVEQRDRHRIDPSKRNIVFVPGPDDKPISEMSREEIREMAGVLYDELIRQRDAAAAAVQVGDLNPRTPPGARSGDCPASHPTAHGTALCTLDAGHAGQHVAEANTHVAVLWTD